MLKAMLRRRVAGQLGFGVVAKPNLLVSLGYWWCLAGIWYASLVASLLGLLWSLSGLWWVDIMGR